MADINKAVFNNYTVTPRNLTQYKAYRGVTDFSQIGQFNQYETGYQFLSVISLPKFMTVLGEQDEQIDNLNKSFKHMLEYEFRGMDGLSDLQADTFEITDGINSQQIINRVTMDTSIQVSMSYFERQGSLIEKFAEYYLTGIKDPHTQAKTYHGLIKNNLLAPGYENEVFTLMYYVTDNTMLRIERAVLLCNCQLTRAERSMYNGSRESISNRETTVEFNAFPIFGYEVDKAANYLLKNITGVATTVNNKVVEYSIDNTVTDPTVLDSSNYKWGIMGGDDGTNPDTNPELYAAIQGNS